MKDVFFKYMNNDERKKFKTQGRVLKPFITISGNGISDNAIENIIKNLKANKLTKVKILKSFVDSVPQTKQEIAQEIAEKTKSELIDQVGQVIVLYKR